jgi:hypothetical protein
MGKQTRVAIMQPYIFPYLAYYQLVASSRIFVFYDDVNFINRGWINRNAILVNGNKKRVTFPLVGASQNKLIKEVEIDTRQKEYKKFFKTLSHSYNKAPYFDRTLDIINYVFRPRKTAVSYVARESIEIITDKVGLETRFLSSSQAFENTKELGKADRLIKVSKELGADEYINAAGGREIYSKDYFKAQGLSLKFLEANFPPYDQNVDNFVPGLSIIDILMFNSYEEIRTMIFSHSVN